MIVAAGPSSLRNPELSERCSRESELKIVEGGTDEVHFTVFHTFQMLKKLQADYDAVYNTDKPMPL